MPKFSPSVTYLCLAALLTSATPLMAQDSSANYRLETRGEPKVEVADLPAAGTGLWPPIEFGLRADMWGTMGYDTYAVLLADLPASIPSPTLRGLLSHALLSNATTPDGDVSPAARQDTRSEALMPFVTASEYDMYVASVPAAERTLLHATRQRDLAFAEQGTAACEMLPEAATNITELVWQLYCTLADRNAENRVAAAQLQLDLLRERGLQATAEINLVEAILANEATGQNAPLPVPGALNVQTIRLLSLAPEQGVHVATQAPLVQRTWYYTALERGDAQSASAAEWLAARGFIEADTLRAAYAAATFTADEKNNPNLVRGVRARALLWQRLQDARTDADQLRLLSDFIAASGAEGLHGTRGALLAPYLIEIPSAPEHAWAAGSMLALAASQQVVAAQMAWYDTAATVAQTLPEAQKWLVRMWPLALALQLPAAPIDGLNQWIADAQALSSETRVPVADILTVLEAAGFAIPQETWATVTDTPTAASSKQVDARKLDALRAAAQNNQQAEVIVRAVNMTGGDMNDVPPPVAAAVIRALADVDLATDAQRLTVETLLNLLFPSA